MSQDFQAFTAHAVLDSFQKKIEVLEAWDGKIIAGLADGSLMVLQPDEVDKHGPWQVMQALKQFSKKYVLQIQVITQTLEHRTCAFEEIDSLTGQDC